MVWRKVGGGWRKVVERWRKKFNGILLQACVPTQPLTPLSFWPIAVQPPAATEHNLPRGLWRCLPCISSSIHNTEQLVDQRQALAVHPLHPRCLTVPVSAAAASVVCRQCSSAALPFAGSEVEAAALSSAAQRQLPQLQHLL